MTERSIVEMVLDQGADLTAVASHSKGLEGPEECSDTIAIAQRLNRAARIAAA
jgi:hypothetical protein